MLVQLLMRKRLNPQMDRALDLAPEWLDLEALASVEVTSEEPAHPIERALTRGAAGGWRAAEPGRQVIRLHFDKAQTLAMVRLVFREDTQARTQEFWLRWSESDEAPFQEILRQGYHFSPPGTVEQVENYRVALAGVKVFEISILPDVSGAGAHATLERLTMR